MRERNASERGENRGTANQPSTGSDAATSLKRRGRRGARQMTHQPACGCAGTAWLCAASVVVAVTPPFGLGKQRAM